MNKTQLIDAVAAEAGLTKTDAKKALDAFIKTTSEQLKDGEKIALVGFGTFSILERPARVGRNPKTGEKIEVEKKRIVKFKAGSDLTNDVQ
jgi:DNA-binding protein HU-beta